MWLVQWPRRAEYTLAFGVTLNQGNCLFCSSPAQRIVNCAREGLGLRGGGGGVDTRWGQVSGPAGFAQVQRPPQGRFNS